MKSRVIKYSLVVSVLSLLFVSSAIASAISQGYRSKVPLAKGTIVSTTKNSSNEIEKTTIDNERLVVGIVANENESVISLQPKGTDIGIAVDGEVSLLVSDTNGAIAQGDYLIISPIAGVAMKDSPESKAKKYIAVAAQAFNDKSTGAKLVKAELNDGTNKNVAIGLILAKLVLSGRTETANKKQNILSTITQKVAGKPVSTAQIIASSVVLIATLVLTGLLLNGSIKGSFISLGRNPLSKATILANLFKVMAFALILLAGGMAMSYVILLI